MVAKRGIAVWLVLISAEIVHGIVRGILLKPYVGDLWARQIGVFSGSVVFFTIALAFGRWIDVTRASQLLGIGALWLVLTTVFEVCFGRFASTLSLMKSTVAGAHEILDKLAAPTRYHGGSPSHIPHR